MSAGHLSGEWGMSAALNCALFRHPHGSGKIVLHLFAHAVEQASVGDVLVVHRCNYPLHDLCGSGAQVDQEHREFWTTTRLTVFKGCPGQFAQKSLYESGDFLAPHI